MSQTRRRRVLVLFWHPEPHNIRNSIRQHLEMLETAEPRPEVWYCNTFLPTSSWIRAMRFDAVVLHTTLLCLRWSHLFTLFKWRLRWVADMDCQKIAFPQDEYDHSEVLDEWLYEWGVSVIFSNFDEPQRRRLYPLMRDRARFHKAFTGYIDESSGGHIARRLQPIHRRRLDIVYRASHLPYWFGSHGQLKHQIGTAVGTRARAMGLKVDISTRDEDTVVGSRWLDFLASGKTVIGCESGSSVLDRRGEVRAAIQWMLGENPSLSFEEVSRRIGRDWDDETFFAISPRHFEAIATRTCQILVEGSYDGVLIPNRHYIPLRRDLSNVDEVLETCRDAGQLQQIADRAFDEIYSTGSYTFREFTKRLIEVIPARSHKPALLGPQAAKALGLRKATSDPAGDWGDTPASEPIAIESTPGLIRWTFEYPGRALVTARLLLGDWALFRLVLGYIASRRAQKAVRLVALLRDALVLGIIRQAQAGDLTAGVQFRVDLFLDRRNGYLRLVSRLPTETPSAQVEQMLSARLLARLTNVEFDHSSVGHSIHHLITTHRWVNLALPNGKIQMRALTELARLKPEAALSALNVAATVARSRKSFWRAPIDRFMKGWAAANVTLWDPALRAVAKAWVNDRGLRQQVRLSVLAEDLLKVGLLRRAQAGRLNVGMPFKVEIEVRKSGVQLISQRNGGSAYALSMRARAFKSITWNHAAIGDSIFYKLPGSVVRLHLIGGRHRFESLEKIAESHPDLVTNAVLALPKANTGWRRVRFNPVNYFLKGYAALRVGLTDQATRRILSRSRRASIGLDRVLEDVLKLSLVQRHRGFEISSRRDGSLLRLVSCLPGEKVTKLSAAEARSLIGSRSFDGVEWDHSRIGLNIPLRVLGISTMIYLPQAGVHRFETLKEVAQLDPMIVLELLSQLLAQETVSPPALFLEPIVPAGASTELTHT